VGEQAVARLEFLLNVATQVTLIGVRLIDRLGTGTAAVD
jgi:hypothetical protein